MPNFNFFYFIETYAIYTEAKNAHKTFLQLNADKLENENDKFKAFYSAERYYIASSEAMSQKLADSFVKFDLVSITIGLTCLVTVS